MWKDRLFYIIGIIILFSILVISLMALKNKSVNHPITEQNNISENINLDNIIVISTERNGLFVSYDKGLNYKKVNHPLLAERNGKNVVINKILPLNKGEYIFVTKGKGLLYTKDGCQNIVELNNGIPKKKIVINGKLADNIYRDITAITHDTQNKNTIFITTKYGIYRSLNRGKTWKHYSRPPRYYNNLLTIAFSSKYGFHLYLGTAYNGLFIQEKEKGKWFRLNRGLKMTGSIVEEIGSVSIDRKNPFNVYVGHNFGNRLFKLSTKRIKKKKDQHDKLISYSVRRCRWKAVKLPFRKRNGTVQVLNDINSINIRYTNGKRSLVILTNKGIVISRNDGRSWSSLRINRFLKSFPQATDVNALNIYRNGKLDFNFNNLFLLRSRARFAVKSRYYNKARNKKGFYIQTHVAFQKKRLMRIIKYMKKCNYNMVTIDLKDDFGMVNYHSNLDIVKKVGSDKGTKINLKRFLKIMHENNIHVVARLVVFKDPTLFKYRNGKYAAYDKVKKKAWKGVVYSRRRRRNVFIKERWMDPFSNFVWKYNTAIAKELEQMGVDEIQFDYIRFPTDGDNIDNLKYRYRVKGQQKKDAIESFLYMARQRLTIPISVDIYGANGWYHMGDRIGQDVEMLSEYVDAICPMFYPSHFHVSFLNFKPYKERPYRIYYYGTLRSLTMAAYKVEIRSWLQAFRLKYNKYDRKYYGIDYLAYQILGIRDAGNNGEIGYTWWHSGTKYKKIPRAYKRSKRIRAGIHRRSDLVSYR